jgi:hypothetical protein
MVLIFLTYIMLFPQINFIALLELQQGIEFLRDEWWQSEQGAMLVNAW